MWSDRRQQEETARQSAAASRTDAGSAIQEPLSGGAGRTLGMDSRAIAIIGRGMVIKGQIRSAEHMHIAGEIDGSLYLAGYDLTVTADSRVRADVTAREVDCSGTIQGNVDATRKITVRQGGKLIGDLRTPGIVIEDGAYFKGNIEIVTREARQNEDELTPAVTHTATANA